MPMRFILTIALFILSFFALPQQSQAQSTVDVAGTFNVGIVGTRGNNTGDLLNAINLSTMDLDITYFVIDPSGFGGTQGNDISGYIRFLTADNTVLDISGAINWQIKIKGRTEYIGLTPDNLTTPISFQNANGVTYTFDSTTNFAIRLNGSTVTYPDGTNINGAANPPDLSVLDITTFPYDPNNPPILNAQTVFNVPTGTTLVTNFDTQEWVTWYLRNGEDDDRFTLDPSTGALTFVPAADWFNPTDANQDNSYIIVINAIDADGNVSTLTVTVNVMPPPPDLSSSKTVNVVSATYTTGSFDCALDPPLSGSFAYIPGECVEYIVTVNNATGVGPAFNLNVVDTIPLNLTLVSIINSNGFDSLSISGDTITGTRNVFPPGGSMSFTARALID